MFKIALYLLGFLICYLVTVKINDPFGIYFLIFICSLVLLSIIICGVFILKKNYYASAFVFLQLLTLGGLSYLEKVDQREIYNKQIAQLETLRREVILYHQAHKSYPLRLEDLSLKKRMRFKSLLGKKIVYYSKSPTGFTLSMSDSFITHSGTESLPVDSFK